MSESSLPSLLRQKILKVSSKRRHLSTINNFYEYLRQRNADDKEIIFKNNPVKMKIHSISVKEKDVITIKLLTPEHWEKITDKTTGSRPLYAPFALLWRAKTSELTFLRVKDFNPETKTINFVRTGDVHRLKIQNFDRIYALLNDYLETKKTHSEYVFTNKAAESIQLKTLYNHIKNTKAEILDDDLASHSFRKACATNLYIKTKDLLQVRDYLNHSDAKVTQTYIEY
ncbi:MAG: site-specific integrase [Bacteriovoracaceae bacterium]